MTDEVAVEKPKKEKEEKIVFLMNRGERTFYVGGKDNKLTIKPGDHEVKESIAKKLVADYPREFKIIGKQ